MRLDINLASQPYEDSRQFWMRWGTALVAVGVLTLALVATTISGWAAARHDHAKIAELKASIAQRDRTRAQAEEFLNRPENRTTRDESQFLNQMIERKTFSWTHVLEDLERVMPARVHLVSIHPELNEDNQLTLKMLVGGDSRDKALELARRMEESKHFSQTYIQNESYQTSNSGDPVQFAIVATYVPESAGIAPQTPVKTADASPDAPLPHAKTSNAKTSNAKTSDPKPANAAKTSKISQRSAP